MKNKTLLFCLKIMSGLGFAISLAWLGSELFVNLKYNEINKYSVIATVISFFLYGLFHVLHSPKVKYVRRKIIPINDYYGITQDSQTPIKLQHAKD